MVSVTVSTTSTTTTGQIDNDTGHVRKMNPV